MPPSPDLVRTESASPVPVAPMRRGPAKRTDDDEALLPSERWRDLEERLAAFSATATGTAPVDARLTQ
jgi:hypothetical protein